MALPTVLTGSTFCQGKGAKGKHVSPFLYPGLQLPVHSLATALCQPLALLWCAKHHVTPPPSSAVPLGLSCLVRAGEAVPWGVQPWQRHPWLGFSSHWRQGVRHDRGATASCKSLHSTKPVQAAFPKGSTSPSLSLPAELSGDLYEQMNTWFQSPSMAVLNER